MKYFVTVVEEKSFTEASEKLFISQSAVSQQIKALENELGVSLLVREKRSFRPTPTGEYFYAQSKNILKEVEELRVKTVEIGSEDVSESRLRVGYLSNFSGPELSLAVGRFSEIYPDIQIEIVSGTHEELYLGMLKGTIDMAFNDQRRAFSDDFVNFEIVKCDCYIEISKRHPLCEKEYIDVANLNSIPCILISSKDQQEIELDYYKNTLGYDCPFVFAKNLEEARLMVVGNRGFLPVESVHPSIEKDITIQRIPVYKNKKVLRRNYCVFWLKDRENYYMEEFGHFLHEIFHK